MKMLLKAFLDNAEYELLEDIELLIHISSLSRRLQSAVPR
jgi:hypothetical protein